MRETLLFPFYRCINLLQVPQKFASQNHTAIGINIYTIIYKVYNQQGPTEEHGEPCSVFIITYKGNEPEKEYIYMCVCAYTYICVYN